jgi:phosphoribosyl 1,2-cyclic phosphodiesterase
VSLSPRSEPHPDRRTGKCATRGFPGGNIVKVCVLATSSSGNSIYLSSGRTRLLVDAGLSRKEAHRRLEAIGEDPAQLDAILITHEHSDHTSSLLPLARPSKDRRIPVYLSRGTAPSIDWNGVEPVVEMFQAGTSFPVGDFEVQSFTIPHDAADPVGFTFRAGGVKIGVAMDLGYIPESVKYHLHGANLLILESNHDLYMLKVGPYPWAVKQRVMGRRGHLSNDAVSEFILDAMDPWVDRLVLGHLSEHNNYPATVHLVADQALARRGLATRLTVAEPGRQSEVFEY